MGKGKDVLGVRRAVQYEKNETVWEKRRFLPLPIARVIKVTSDNVYWTTLTIVFAIRLFACFFRARIRTTFYCEYCADYFSKGISLTDVQMIFVTAVSLSPISLRGSSGEDCHLLPHYGTLPFYWRFKDFFVLHSFLIPRLKFLISLLRHHPL